MSKIIGSFTVVALAALWIGGCPASPPEISGPSATGSNPGSSTGNASLDDPAANTPDDSAPGLDLDENGAPPIDPSMVPEPGAGVTVSGTATYAGSEKGSIRVDIMKADAAKGTVESPFNSVLAEANGGWSFEVPKDLDTVAVVAYIDLNNDGPNPGEPADLAQNVAVGAKGVTGIELTLTEDPDTFKSLGAPEGGPGRDKPAPQGGTPPPDGAPPGGTPPPDGDTAPPGGTPPPDGDTAPPGGTPPPAGATTPPSE